MTLSGGKQPAGAFDTCDFIRVFDKATRAVSLSVHADEIIDRSKGLSEEVASRNWQVPV